MVTPLPFDRDPTMRGHGIPGDPLPQAFAQAVIAFERKYLKGRPRHIEAYVVHDVAIVRVHGILSPAELQLAGTSDGRVLMRQLFLKEIEEIRDMLLFELQSVAGSPVKGLTVDLDAENDERVIVCRFDRPIVLADQENRGDTG